MAGFAVVVGGTGPTAARSSNSLAGCAGCRSAGATGAARGWAVALSAGSTELAELSISLIAPACSPRAASKVAASTAGIFQLAVFMVVKSR